MRTLIAANTFHPFPFGADSYSQWTSDLAALNDLISPMRAPDGVSETTLLNWFGASVERIALLAYAIHGVVPTHVARELTIGDFRADFGWAAVAEKVDAMVGLIELENCAPTTLFEKKKRKAPYLGTRFLNGFGQLVDWCAFGRSEAKVDATISTLLGARHLNASYSFALVAGDRRFSNDALSLARLQWWRENLNMGHGATMITFDQVAQFAARSLSTLEKVR